MRDRVFSLLWLRREEPHWPVQEKPGGRAHKRQELSLLASGQLSSPARGGKGLALPSFGKGHQGSGLPGRAPTASLRWGLEGPSEVPCPAVSAVCPALACPVHVCLQFPGCWDRTIGYLPLGRRPCASAPKEAEFALIESIGWFGCDGEQDLAQQAVNSAAAFSAHSYCQGSNYSCTYFPIELI